MSSIGVIGGTGFKEWESFEIEEEMEKITPWGTPSSPIYRGEINDIEIFLLLRHGKDHDIPPHKINHQANIYALQKQVEDIIGLSSAGALKSEIDVPTISIPRDYVNLWDVKTFYDEEIKHITPGFSSPLRKDIINSSEKVHSDVRSDDIYVKTKGPRLETEAEVKILKSYGDLVGMTLPPEATLCKEAGVGYASIVSVDNYAHGVNEEKVDYEDIVETARKNWDVVKEILNEFLGRRK